MKRIIFDNFENDDNEMYSNLIYILKRAKFNVIVHLYNGTIKKGTFGTYFYDTFENGGRMIAIKIYGENEVFRIPVKKIKDTKFELKEY